MASFCVRAYVWSKLLLAQDASGFALHAWSDTMPVQKLHVKQSALPRGKDRKPSARLSPYLRGIVCGMHLVGATLDDIHKKLRKPDGSDLTPPGAWSCIQLCELNGGVNWDFLATSSCSTARAVFL